MMKNVSANKPADPNYFATQPETLQSEAQLVSFIVGNGDDIYSHICPAIEQAHDEVVLITCFWARSSSLDKLTHSLRTLSNRVTANKEPKIRIFIGFSSLSALQKLFHVRSTRGRLWHPSEWAKKLWLPDASELPGLDIQIKSIFVLPFSVMHPKFVIVDRRIVFLPSCNVSWESWFEGCLALSGPIVRQFTTFWEVFWLRSETVSHAQNGSTPSSQEGLHPTRGPVDDDRGAAHDSVNLEHLGFCYSVFLPSPHHISPRFSLPWQECSSPPPTPLNTFTSELIDSATRSIYIQTPNVTSPPVLKLVLRALRRGVDVKILTSEKLMILEQLVTAGTTTARCVKKLVKLYKRASSAPLVLDEESVRPALGQLMINYYQPRAESERQNGEPVQSHLKLTIVDDEWIILGSGNQDRASWYTSQELGVALKSTELATEIRRVVGGQMSGRIKLAFDSSAHRV
jgi:phosphatidylserine/phosphatidylglycerophosphate/cardiolipin synthase-like enzyme